MKEIAKKIVEEGASVTSFDRVSVKSMSDLASVDASTLDAGTIAVVDDVMSSFQLIPSTFQDDSIHVVSARKRPEMRWLVNDWLYLNGKP
jgi:hypothetical protein